MGFLDWFKPKSGEEKCKERKMHRFGVTVHDQFKRPFRMCCDCGYSEIKVKGKWEERINGARKKQ